MNPGNKFQRELNFSDYIRLLVKNRYILLFTVVSFMAPTWWLVQRVPDYYIASSQIVMDKQEGQNLMLLESQGNQKNLGYYRAIFGSQAFMEKLIQALGPELAKTSIEGKARAFLTDRLYLTEGSVESFISVQAKTPSAELSYAMVRHATDSLIIFCRKVENEESEKAIEAIKQQIEVCVRKRDEIQLEKSRLSDVSKLATLGDFAGLTALEKSYQDELVKYELDKANLEAKKSYFRTLDAAVNGPAKGGNDSLLAQLRAQMKTLEKEKDKMMRLGIALSPDSKLNLDIQAAEERIVKLGKRNESQDLGILSQWQLIRKEVSAGEAEMQQKK